jgi:hypothetical protein
MHRFTRLASFATTALLLQACPEVQSCGAGLRYDGTSCVDDDLDAGNRDATVPDGDVEEDGGPPCGGACDLAHCDTDTQLCRECIGDDECDDPALAVCSGGRCIECTTSDQCTRLGLGECFDGECLDCTPGNEETVCGAFVCDPGSGECTEQVRGTTGVCLPCVADSQCGDDNLCVPMSYMTVPRIGGYCLRQFSRGCARPYTVEITGRTTLSLVAGESFCGIDEMATTCEAVLAFGNTCATGAATECAPSGATCGVVGGVANTCTYPCADMLECPGTRACPTFSNYCGGPTS